MRETHWQEDKQNVESRCSFGEGSLIFAVVVADFVMFSTVVDLVDANFGFSPGQMK